jgi:hypothetical protein
MTRTVLPTWDGTRGTTRGIGSELQTDHYLDGYRIKLVEM